MTYKKYLFLLALPIFLIACRQSGTIQVQNNVSSVKLTDISWGDISLQGSIINGENTKKLTIYKSNEHLPASYAVSFRMIANDQEVYLRTEEEYLLDYDDELIIVIDDNTPVYNP